MKRKSGFTLVELVVTTGITVILLLVAVPRYNSFINKQDFSSNVQNLTHCIRLAQEAATTPAEDVDSQRTGYVRLQVNNVAGTNKVDCTVDRYQHLRSSDGQTFSLTSGLNSLNGVVKVDAGNYYKATYENLKLLEASPNEEAWGATPDTLAMVLIFGVREHGVPLVFCRNNCVPGQGGNHTNPFPGPDLDSYRDGLGLGFSSALLIGDASNTNTRGTINIHSLGAPVSFTLIK